MFPPSTAFQLRGLILSNNGEWVEAKIPPAQWLPVVLQLIKKNPVFEILVAFGRDVPL